MERGWKRVTHGFREGREYLTNTLCFGFSGDTDKASLKQAEDVLSAIGGVFVPTDKESGIYAHWAFNYDPKEVIDQIVCSGSIPDQKSHQFYPTPVDVAAKAVEKAMASATPNMIWLEPSAGIGGLADLMPKERLQCVEISPLHCKILKSKGYSVEEADFLKLPVNGPFDRIVMNPPFSEGRWQAHVQHAALMLKDDGVLVAILPASAKGKHLLEGFDHDWSAVLDNKFSGTSVSVVILTAVRKQ